jgi:hypothetical protein
MVFEVERQHRYLTRSQALTKARRIGASAARRSDAPKRLVARVG